MRPFVINSNICLDESQISSFSILMRNINYNIGNSYITYSILKELCDNPLSDLLNLRYNDDNQNFYTKINELNSVGGGNTFQRRII